MQRPALADMARHTVRQTTVVRDEWCTYLALVTYKETQGWAVDIQAAGDAARRDGARDEAGSALADHKGRAGRRHSARST